MSNFAKLNPSTYDRLPMDQVFNPVEEAYFGRSKYLKQAEEGFATLIKLVRSEYDPGKDDDMLDLTGQHKAMEKALISAEGKKATAKIEEGFKKQFGFRSFNLYWSRELGVLGGPNAMTFMNGCIRRIATAGMRNLVPLKQASGGYFDKSHTYTCTVMVATAMFDMKNVTAGELMGLMLHEIGHNFQCTPMANIGMILPVIDIYNATLGAAASLANPTFEFLKNMLVHNFIGEITGVISKVINKIYDYIGPDIRDITDRIDHGATALVILGMNYIPFINAANQLAVTGSKVAQFTALGPIVAAKVMAGYSGEVFADSFATAYGYGPELSSALAKMHNTLTIDYNYLLSDDNPFGVVYQLSILSFEIAGSILSLDEHPSTQKRIINQLKKLEREANSSDLPPDMKKSIQADIKRHKEIYEKFLNADTGKNKLAIVATYRALNDSLGGNLDWRGILNKVLNFGKYEA